jgi:dihydropyrimidine dehydrogenase (NAD+) subunit PreT
MGDIASGRLPISELAANFSDAHPPLTTGQAVVEAERCYFCHDAPCIAACPTGIDIPLFIRKIATGNLRGSALTILDANILGGSCARVCPTEELCERACVHTAQEGQPIKIGALQRHSTDWLLGRETTPFARAASTGHHVAVVGAGPAGLACAHRLAQLGNTVTIFDAHDKLGGLNEYGLAAYKVAEDFAQREIRFVLAIGGITIEHGKVLGRDISFAELRRNYDAVFLGIGQTGVQQLGLHDEYVAGVRNAVDFIADVRQLPSDRVSVGRRVIVLGGGNTAIDAAVQSRCLGAEDVTIVYRRGPHHMSATEDEQAWAKTHDVRIRHWAAPTRLLVDNEGITGVVFARTRLDSAGKLTHTDDTYQLEADMVLKAIGQRLVGDSITEFLATTAGRIAVDNERATSIPGVYAGGDCVPGQDLTVRAVEDGKQAAEAIHRRLGGSTIADR